MRVPSYLVQSRCNVFYFRWPLPSSIHPHAKRSDIKVSLRTRTPHKALQLSRYLAYLADILTSEALASGMRYDEIRRTLKTAFKEALSRKKAKIDAQGRLKPLEITSLQNSLAFAEEALKNDTALFPEDESNHIRNFVENTDILDKLSSEDIPVLKTEYRKACIAYYKELLAYDQSFEELRLSSETVGIIDQVENNCEPAITLGDAIDQYIKEHTGQGMKMWGVRAQEEKHRMFNTLFEIIGKQTDIRSITKANARHVKEVLREVPAFKNTNAKIKHLSILEACKVEGLKRIAPKTVNGYLSTYSSFFIWTVKQGYADNNVFEGLTINTKGATSQSSLRDMFTDEQVNAIKNAVLNDTFGDVSKSYRRWGVLLGIYTGARREEICQLHVSDIKCEDNIWYIDINDDEDKELKTPASKRSIPIHPALIEFGFIDHVEELQRIGQRRLFAELSNVANRGYGKNLGRWFNEKLLTNLGIKTDKLNFHSLRHTVVTKLLNSGVEQAIAQSIIGHTPIGVTQRVYNKGYDLEAKDHAIRKLLY